MDDPQGPDGNARVEVPFDAPTCSECGDSADEMFLADYEIMRAGGASICSACRTEMMFLARLRKSAGDNGFRVGI